MNASEARTINGIVRDLSKYQYDVDIENAKVIIKYKVEHEGVTTAIIHSDIWDTIQERVKIRRECENFKDMRYVVESLKSEFGYDGLISQLSQLPDNSVTTELICNDNTRRIGVDISPKILLEVAIDLKDQKRSLDRHCGEYSDDEEDINKDKKYVYSLITKYSW